MGGRVVTPRSNAAHLGGRLRTARQRLGWNLGEASAATAIPAAYLDALEQGRLDLLPSPVYTRGYVRTYASALHLDGDELTYAYNRLQPQGRFDALGAQPSAPRRTTTGSPRRWARILGIALAAILGLLVLNALWAAVGPDGAEDSSLDRPRPPTGQAQPGPAQPAPPAEGAPPAPAAPLTPTAADTEGAAYSVGRPNFVVTIEPTGRAWLQLRQGPDGDVIYEGTLQPGETKVVPATGALWMRVGDQGNVRVLLDGAPLALPGTSGTPYNVDLKA